MATTFTWAQSSYAEAIAVTPKRVTHAASVTGHPGHERLGLEVMSLEVWARIGLVVGNK